MRSCKFYGIQPRTNRELAIFRLCEEVVRAEEELATYRTSGTQISPDVLYELMLSITEDETKARNAQAELMLQLMAHQ